MRRAAMLALLVASMPAVAAAHLAVDVVREVMRGATPAVRACVEAHRLPPGRYHVHVVVLEDGKVGDVALVESPAPLSAAGASCLVAAFAALRFAPLGTGPKPPSSMAWVHGRHVRVPPGPGTHPAAGMVSIDWPFVISPP